MIYPYLGPWWDHLGGVSRDGSPLIGPLEKLWKIHWINTQLPESPEAIRRRARQPWRPRAGNMRRSTKAGLHWEAKPQLHVQSPMHAKCNSLSEFSESIDWQCLISPFRRNTDMTWNVTACCQCSALHWLHWSMHPKNIKPNICHRKISCQSCSLHWETDLPWRDLRIKWLRWLAISSVPSGYLT